MNKNKRIHKQVLTLGAVAAIGVVAGSDLSAEGLNENNAKVPATSEKASDYVVSFADPRLKAHINQQLGQEPTADIRQSQMQTIKKIDISNKGISSLSGLRYATNLEELIANNNKLTDYYDLRKLENLKKIDLSHNQLRTVGSLEGNKSINDLNLSHNQITTYSNLDQANLNNGTIDLSHNYITRVDKRSTITNCANLNLEYNNIHSFEGLGEVLKTTNVSYDNQSVTLQDYFVTDQRPVHTIVKDVNGENIIVELGVPKIGTYKYSLPKEVVTNPSLGTKTTITFSGVVTYEDFMISDTANVKLGANLTDEDLLKLFNATGSYTDGTPMKITVDQSDVDYNKAGTYIVDFSATNSNGDKLKHSGKLTVGNPIDETVDNNNSNNNNNNTGNNNTGNDTTTTEKVPEQINNNSNISKDTADTNTINNPKSENTSTSNKAVDTTTTLDKKDTTNTKPTKAESESTKTATNDLSTNKSLAKTGLKTNVGIVLGITATLSVLVYVRKKQK